MLKSNFKQGKRYSFATHTNEILLPREKAEIIEAFRVVIEPGKATPAHKHPDTEQLYYVVSGRGKGVLKFPDGKKEETELLPEDVLYIPRNTEHQIFCTSAGEPLTYLCVDGFPLGKPADEPTWESHYNAVVKQLGKKRA